MNAATAYRTLHLDASATDEEVKAAYRRMVLECHPDKNGKGDDQRFKRITEAYHAIRESSKEPAKVDTPSPEKKSQWGAPPNRGKPKGAPPEEDWSRYTREFEENESFWKEYERRFWQMYDEHVGSAGRRGEEEKRREPEEQPDLSVRVDESLCIGCCSCEIIAPGVFSIDKETKMNPKSRVHNAGGAGVNDIMNAAQTCPTKAILVEDASTGERLHPR